MLDILSHLSIQKGRGRAVPYLGEGGPLLLGLGRGVLDGEHLRGLDRVDGIAADRPHLPTAPHREGASK